MLTAARTPNLTASMFSKGSDFVMDKSGAGAGFLSENFGFPCQSTFHLLLHNHLHYHTMLAQ
jgi:hypothetical protein